MKPSQTIFNKDTQTVTISEEEYFSLVKKANERDSYKEICEDFKAVLEGDSE